MISATNPRSVDAHLGFNASYIWFAKRGKAAPKALRKTVFEASADAATKRYASIK